MPGVKRSVLISDSGRIRRPWSGCGRTIPVMPKQRRLPNWHRGFALTISPRSAACILQNGGGAKSFTVRRRLPMCLKQRGAGWRSAIGFRPSWWARRHPIRSNAASVRPAIRRCSMPPGRDCRMRNFSKHCPPVSVHFARVCMIRRILPTRAPVTFLPPGRRNSASPRTSPLP